MKAPKPPCPTSFLPPSLSLGSTWPPRAVLGSCFAPRLSAKYKSLGSQRTFRTWDNTVALPDPCLGLYHLPSCQRAPSWNQCGWAQLCLPWVGMAGSQQLRAQQVCEAPAPECAHAGVWVCHSLVSKLISGSLTRGIKSRSHNGIHSSSCPGKEQAPHCPLGLGLGQAKVAGAQLPAGGPCLHPPSSLPQDRTGTRPMFL